MPFYYTRYFGLVARQFAGCVYTFLYSCTSIISKKREAVVLQKKKKKVNQFRDSYSIYRELH